MFDTLKFKVQSGEIQVLNHRVHFSAFESDTVGKMRPTPVRCGIAGALAILYFYSPFKSLVNQLGGCLVY